MELLELLPNRILFHTSVEIVDLRLYSHRSSQPFRTPQQKLLRSVCLFELNKNLRRRLEGLRLVAGVISEGQVVLGSSVVGLEEGGGSVGRGGRKEVEKSERSEESEGEKESTFGRGRFGRSRRSLVGLR